MNRTTGDAAAERGAGLCVLVVDDDASILRIVSLLLRQGGFEVVEASGAVAAREHLERSVPDVALIDVRLRGGSGVALADELESRYGMRGRVALMTGGERPRPGPCLLKPFGRDQLLGVVRQLGQGAAPAAPPEPGAGRATETSAASSR